MKPNRMLTVLLTGLMVCAGALGAQDIQPVVAPTPPTPAVTPAPQPATGGATDAAQGLGLDDYELLSKAADGLSADDPAAIEKARKRCAELAPQYKAALFASLHDENSLKKHLAIKLMPYVGDAPAAAKAVGELLAGDHKDADDHMRLLAAMTLYELPDPAGFDAAVSALANDSSDKVRAAAAEALGKFNDDRAVAPLIKALNDDAKQVRGNAAAALARLKLDKDKVLAALLNAADTEPDLAVKGRIQGAIATLQDHPNPANADDKEDPLKVLANLADDMGNIEGKLRNDQHQLAENAQVVGDQQNVVSRLNALVKKLEQQQQQSSSSSKSKKKSQQQQQQQQKPGEGEGKKPGSKSGGHSQQGATQSTNQPGSVQYNSERTETGSMVQKFTDLPDAEREKLNTLRGQGIPDNWANVLESYWNSVNKLQAQEDNKQNGDNK
ncbi:MAG: HEAT repeat domain-containing protein [Planctomycetota bacterium]